MPECSAEDCEEPATVELHVPWGENRMVCSGHARVLSQQDGIVADPIVDDEEWP